MRAIWLGAIAIAFVPAIFAAAAEETAMPGQVSSEDSYTPAPGETAKPYRDVTDENVSGPSKGMPGLVSEVQFINDRYDVVFMRTRLLNGTIENIRLLRGQFYLAPTRGEPAICMCWGPVKEVNRCLQPDPVAVPVNTSFRFGQGGVFQKCSTSF